MQKDILGMDSLKSSAQDSLCLTSRKNLVKDYPSSSQDVLVGEFGAPIGVDGAIKLFVYTDFMEIFRSDVIFSSSSKNINRLTLRNLESSPKGYFKATFENIDSREKATLLTNHSLYCTKEDSYRFCNIGEESFFWFDVVGCVLEEGGKRVGEVVDIERIGALDYLHIRADEQVLIEVLSEKSLKKAKNIFLLPYIKPYIERVDIKNKQIFTRDAIGVMESSLG